MYRTSPKATPITISLRSGGRKPADAGFGKGTYAEHVATFVAKKLVEKARA